MTAREVRGLAGGLALLVLAGCLAKGQPVVAERSPTERPPPRGIAKAVVDEPRRNLPVSYIVRRGDTLYSIAWRYQLDHVALARTNGIRAPYTIVPGQRIRLRIDARPQTAATAPKPATSPSQPATSQAKSAPVQPRQARPKPAPPTRQVAADTSRWVMPVAGAPSGEFTARRKGLDFSFDRGTHPIKAATGGRVVYAGNGLGGYEHLIILRHTTDLLSAYSFNGRITVAEGAEVKAGGKIADILVTGRASQKFHFELRRSGNPIDPRSLIR